MSEIPTNIVTLEDVKNLASRLNLQTDPVPSALQRNELIGRLNLWLTSPECFQSKEVELYAQEIRKWL